MGSFSWTRAERITPRSNLSEGDRYKILVPKEFGGGYILDTYFDYGYVFYYDNGVYVDDAGKEHQANEFPKADLYGILAYWNQCRGMEFDGDGYPKTMQEILRRGKTIQQENRYCGIVIGCYDAQSDGLQFPLKLVSASYCGTYEECAGVSYYDPNQGFVYGKWSNKDYRDILKKLKMAEKTYKENERSKSYGT